MADRARLRGSQAREQSAARGEQRRASAESAAARDPLTRIREPPRSETYCLSFATSPLAPPAVEERDGGGPRTARSKVAMRPSISNSST